MTRLDIERIIDTLRPNDTSEKRWAAIGGRLSRRILPCFGTVEEFYSADIDRFRRTHRTLCGAETAALWQRVRQVIYDRRLAAKKAEEEAEAERRALETRLAAEAAERARVDPYITIVELKQLLELCEYLELPGIRYHKFSEFLAAIRRNDEQP